MICLLPYAQAPDATWLQALQGLRLPLLTRLLAGARAGHAEVQPPTAWSTAHETALAQLLGWPACDGAYPWASYERAAQGGGAWVHLCHWQMGQSSAHLADPSALQLSPEHSQALLTRMAPYFMEDGLQLQFCPERPDRWWAHGEVFKDVRSVSLERMMGQNLGGAWLQEVAQALPAALRRLQSEMQMLLYQDPVNEQRAHSGQPPVNALWFSGCGALSPTCPTPTATAEAVHCERHLQAAALQGDRALWLAQWQTLDATVFPAILAQVDAGTPYRLVLTGRDSWQSLTLARAAGWRGWPWLPQWARQMQAARLRSAWLQTPSNP